MTKSRMESESRLNDRSGSLWLMEGQTGYLFSQNQLRREGDPLLVRLEGSPLRTLQSKVEVLRKMIARFEQQRRQRLAGGEEAESGDASSGEDGQDAGAGRAPAQANEPELAIEEVPTTIVERLNDGNYRVRGDQMFMIGPKEFKVLVSGVVRAEDFSESGISATQLLDPKFDIVSLKRTKR